MSIYDNKTVIITGSNGQLGQFLCKFFIDNFPNYKIVGTYRHKSYDKQDFIFDKSKVIFELMDLCDSVSIENLIIKYKPDYFINTAANAFVGESWDVPAQHFQYNTLGVLYQLEAIRKHSQNTRYFNMGTSEEFANDINDGKIQDENTLINPKSPYGCSKAAARYIVNTYRNSYNLYAIQGWTYNFESELRGVKYFPKKITTGVARIYHAIKNKQTFEPIEVGNLNSYRSWQFCGDVVDGIWRTLNQDVYNKDALNWGGVRRSLKTQEQLAKNVKSYIISASRCNSVKEFIEIAFNYAGIEGYWEGEGINEKYIISNYLHDIGELKSNILVKVNKSFLRPHDVTYLNGDSSLIQKELGWKSTFSLNELIERMVKYDIKNFEVGRN